MIYSFNRNLVLGTVILLFAVLVGSIAFRMEQTQSSPITKVLNYLTPTPTPDSRNIIGQEVPLTNLTIKLNQATRYIRPNSAYDLGVAEVTFKSTTICHSLGEDCSFANSNFKIYSPGQTSQSPIAPPADYVRGLRVLALVERGNLSGMAKETGQVFFQLDKQHNNFTLEYTDEFGKVARFVFQPESYQTSS